MVLDSLHGGSRLDEEETVWAVGILSLGVDCFTSLSIYHSSLDS